MTGHEGNPMKENISRESIFRAVSNSRYNPYNAIRNEDALISEI